MSMLADIYRPPMKTYLRGDTVLETRSAACVELLLSRITSNCNDLRARQIAGFFQETYAADRAQAIANGHLNVHQTVVNE